MSEKPPKMWHLFWTDRAEYWRQCGKIMKARKEGKVITEDDPENEQYTQVQRDAKRYQWLRDNGYLNVWGSSDISDNIDNAIDKAIEESKK